MKATRLIALVPVLLALGACAGVEAYKANYNAYTAAQVKTPQLKLVEFVDSGGKQVTVYSQDGRGIAPPQQPKDPIDRALDLGKEALLYSLKYLGVKTAGDFANNALDKAAKDPLVVQTPEPLVVHPDVIQVPVLPATSASAPPQ